MTVAINPALFNELEAKVTEGKDIFALLVVVFGWLVGWEVVGSASSAETRRVVEGVCFLSGGAPTHRTSEYFRHALDRKFVGQKSCNGSKVLTNSNVNEFRPEQFPFTSTCKFLL